MAFHFEDPSDVKGFYDPALLETPGEELEERVQVLEKEIGRISFLSYDANEQFKLIQELLDALDAVSVRLGNAWEMIEELSEKVDSLSRTLDMLQEVLGVEVVVEEFDIVVSFEADEG